MKKPELSILSALLILCAAGCGGQKSVVGKWKAKEVIPPATTEMGMAFEKIMLQTSLEFRGDGTVTMSMGAMNTTGKYTVNGSAIDVKVEGPMSTGATTSNFELSADGKTLSRLAKSSGDKLVFERA